MSNVVGDHRSARVAGTWTPSGSGGGGSRAASPAEAAAIDRIVEWAIVNHPDAVLGLLDSEQAQIIRHIYRGVVQRHGRL